MAKKDKAVRACRFCGCTDSTPCIVGGVACHWVTKDVRSACEVKLKMAKKKEDKNELISIKLSADNRRKFNCQLTDAKIAYCKKNQKAIPDLELPAGWPQGDCEITMAQLVIVAKRLNAKIKITNLTIN